MENQRVWSTPAPRKYPSLCLRIRALIIASRRASASGLVSKSKSQNDPAFPLDSALAERLTLCKLFLQQERPNDAVKAIANLVIAVLNSDKPVRRNLQNELKCWPQLGVNLTLGSEGYSCHLSSSEFSQMQAAAYFHFIEATLLHAAVTPNAGAAKSKLIPYLVNMIDELIDHLHYSKSGYQRKKLCEQVFRFKTLILKRFHCQTYTTTHINLISKYLHEPANRVERILNRNTLETKLMDHRRNTVLTQRQLAAHDSRFRISRLEQYQRFLEIDQGSRVITSFHLGDYIYSIGHLMSLEPRMRNALLMRQQSCGFENSNNILRQAGDRSWPRSAHILSNKPPLRQLTSQLRAGGTSLVLFCDLPENYGETVNVTFLGRPARFPKGPATLAVLGRAPILPVITYFDGEYFQIHIGDLINTTPIDGENPDQSCARITQQLVNFFEPVFLKYPEQWRYLGLLPSYFKN